MSGARPGITTAILAVLSMEGNGPVWERNIELFAVVHGTALRTTYAPLSFMDRSHLPNERHRFSCCGGFANE